MFVDNNSYNVSVCCNPLFCSSVPIVFFRIHLALVLYFSSFRKASRCLERKIAQKDSFEFPTEQANLYGFWRNEMILHFSSSSSYVPNSTIVCLGNEMVLHFCLDICQRGAASSSKKSPEILLDCASKPEVYAFLIRSDK